MAVGEGEKIRKDRENKVSDVFDFFSIGKLKIGWILAVIFSLILILIGVISFAQQEKYGDIVTGLRTPGYGGVSWGLYVVFIIYFIGISFAGITISALTRIFGMKELRPLTRPAELLTIISLILGAMSVLADQGRVLYALLNLPRYARVMSPMFGTFTMVIAGYLFASLVYFYLSARADAWFMASRSRGFLRIFYKILALGFSGKTDDYLRHSYSSFRLAIFILPLLVTAHSTLGFIFGIQAGRPGWFSALQAPGFVIMAGISGTGMLGIIAYLLRKIYKLEDFITEKAFRTLGTMLMMLTITYIYFMIVEELTANYAAPRKEREVAHAIAFGPYAIPFWTTVVCLLVSFVMLFYQFVSRKTFIWINLLSSLLVNVAAVSKRFFIVVPSQTHGFYLAYPEGSYHISPVEIGIILGLVGFGILLYIIFAKIFPIIPLDTAGIREEPEEENLERTEYGTTLLLRRFAFVLTLLLGFILMIVGFLASARVGTKPYLDPPIPFAPVIFILGIMLSFISAVVYEVFPGKYRTQPSSEKF